MPSEKAARVTSKRRLRNRAKRRAARTQKVTTERLIRSADADSATDAVRKTISILDKTAQGKIIHRNTAARYKSRLMRKLNKLIASEAASA